MKNSSSSIDWRSDIHALKKYQFLYHFLPHPEEKRRATLLLNKSLFIYCVLIMCVGLVFRLIPVYLPGVLGYASNINTSDLLNYTNKTRGEAGLASLKINDRLSNAAQKKAQHMFSKGYWAHIAPDGTEPWDFILGAGYDYVYAGENLAKNFSNSKDVVKAWYNSPSHKQNLLSKNYTDVGYAVVNGVLNGYETTLVVQMFGIPRYVAPNTTNVKPVYQQQQEAPVPAPTSIKEVETKVKQITSQVVEQPMIYQQINVSPTIDVHKATKFLSIVFGGFLLLLLVLDMWYSKKMGIAKINGHTLAHITFLILVIASIWFVIKPGTII
jgi:hypothetical protein